MSTVERLDEAVRLTAVSAYGARFTDLVVRYGEVVVLTGPNGAGKSTVSRLVVGELMVAGSVQVLGSDPVTADLKGRIGYLVKNLETMGSLSSRDVLDICAAVRGCGTAYAHQLAGRLGLELDRPMGELSRGQLRRLGIVQALMHEPELVVLDDPITELDDTARQVLPTLLHEAARRGAAVLVTAQAESDAELLAGRIVQLRRNDSNETPQPQAGLATPQAVVAGGSVGSAEAERAALVERPGVPDSAWLRGGSSGALRVQQAYDRQYDERRDHGDCDDPDRDRYGPAPPWHPLGVVRRCAIRPVAVHLLPPALIPRLPPVHCCTGTNARGEGHRLAHPPRGRAEVPEWLDRTALVGARGISDDGRDGGNLPGGRTKP